MVANDSHLAVEEPLRSCIRKISLHKTMEKTSTMQNKRVAAGRRGGFAKEDASDCDTASGSHSTPIESGDSVTTGASRSSNELRTNSTRPRAGSTDGSTIRKNPSRGSKDGRSSHTNNDRSNMLSRSLSKEDLKIEAVEDFFADFAEEEFDCAWAEAPEAQSEQRKPEKSRLARSRRLGPGDRHKELMRRTSSRRLLGDSAHGSTSGSSHEGGGGLTRRGSKRDVFLLEEKRGGPRREGSGKRISVENTAPPADGDQSKIKKSLSTQGRQSSTKNMGRRNSLRGGHSGKSEGKISPEDLSKESGAAASVIAPVRRSGAGRRRGSTGGGSGFPQQRRNSIGRTPAMERRMSSRGLLAPEIPNEPVVPARPAFKRTPSRRLSMVGGGLETSRHQDPPGDSVEMPRSPKGRQKRSVARRSSMGGGRADLSSYRTNSGEVPSYRTSSGQERRLSMRSGMEQPSLAIVGNRNIRW
jgi:hypothetical protein